jgi:DNA-binding transcriptional ArsR family regulator
MERNDAVAALSALAHDSRLDIFRLLVGVGAEGLAAGAIAERLSLPAPTLSFHLAQLRQAGLATVRRDGRSLIYAADYAAMNALMTFLTDNCCAGNPAACGVPVCDPARGALVRISGGRVSGGRGNRARAKRARA